MGDLSSRHIEPDRAVADVFSHRSGRQQGRESSSEAVAGQAQYAQEHVMRKVLRGFARAEDGNVILIGIIPVPHSKDKPSPREREDKRHLIRQGATIFKKEIVR
jgi:hypothetical protein